MSSVIIAGDVSGSVTLQAPATAGSTVVNLPSTLGNTGTSSFATTDASGNLGIGVTPSAWASGWKVLQNTEGYFASTAADAVAMGLNNYYDGSSYRYIADGYASQYQQASDGTHFWRIAASGTAGNAISFTQAMTLDASGNLGVGTSSPSHKLHIAGDVRISDTYSLFMGVGAEQKIFVGGTASSTYLTFNQWTGAAYTERARIDSSGSLLVGTTSNSGYGGLITASAATSSFNLMTLRDTGTTYGSGQVYALFQNSGGSTAGSIQHTASTTVNYSTSSDARLKTSLGVATDTSVIDNTIIHDFEWIEDGRIDRGVFAQEANEVKPSAVVAGKDDLTEEGNLVSPWGVDYSKYVPDLIVHAQQMKKLIQEQQAMIAEQSTLITQLQADVAALKGN